MSWQEDLQQLDAALAAGQLSADDYRRSRDELLTKASGGAAQAVAPTPVEPTPPEPPEQEKPPPRQDAFAPPFRWQSTPPPVSTTEATQSLRPSGPDAERTQVVDGGPGERTQVVRGGPDPGYYRPGPWPPPPRQQQPDTSAPWAGGEFPPLGPAANWAIKQGPEVFTDSPGNGRRALIISLVLVVVLGLGAGTYFLFFRQAAATPAPNHPTATRTATPTTPPPNPNDPLAIANLPGTRQNQSGITSFDDVVHAEILTPSENTAYQNAGATSARLATATLPGGVHVSVLTVRTSSPSAASTAVASLVALQETYSMQPYPGTAPDNVHVTEIGAIAPNPATIRAHYVHNSTVVRVQVYGPGGTPSGFSADFDRILAHQVALLPADG